MTGTDTTPTSSAGTTAPPSRKGRQTRARLIGAAKVVFEKTGYRNARIADIVAEAGVSHGTFYHYFDSKEQIFREVAVDQLVTMTTIPERPGRRPFEPPSPYERIRAANASYLEAYRDEVAIMRVIEEVSRYDPEVYKVLERRHREFGARLEHAIVELQEGGQADRRIDPEFAASALGGMVAKFAEMMLVHSYADYGLMHSIDQLTLLWANAIGLETRARF